MKRTPLHPFITLLLLLGTAAFLPACADLKSDGARTFLLRSNTVNVTEATTQLMAAISSRLEETGVLDEGYPIQGGIELEADSSDPGVQIMHCVPAQQPTTTAAPCLLLNEGGDFIRAQAVTCESAAFHMYRVYVTPRRLFTSVNPAKDFVGLDVFIREETTLWQVVDNAIRESAIQVGAHPWR